MRIGSRGESYIGSLKNILEKFYEEPLVGFFILCRERGDVIMWHVPFRKSLMRGSQKHLAVKRGYGVPIAKLNFIKNRGHNMPPIYFQYSKISAHRSSKYCRSILFISFSSISKYLYDSCNFRIKYFSTFL